MRISPTSSRHHPFSLVELLLTMAVVLVLFAISIPTIRGTLRANKVNVAASTVAQELRLARARAVTSGRHVALLIPTAEHSDAGGFSAPMYKASAIRACYLTGSPITRTDAYGSWYEGTFDNYIEGTSWTFLPAGTYVGYTESFGPFSKQSVEYSRRSCNVVSGVLFPNVSSPLAPITNVRAIVFTPTGTILPAPKTGSHTRFWVVEGVIKSGTDELLHDPYNFVGAEINRFTGKFRFVTD